MANGNDLAFDAMNDALAGEEVDLTEDDEVSAWFPEGKFLGMKIPKGTAGIVEGLVFLGLASPGPKVASAVTSQIRKQVASFSPEMQKAAAGKASDYLARAENISRKLAVAGKEGIAEANLIFEQAAIEAPKGLARSRVLAEIAKDKSVLEFARKAKHPLSGKFKSPSKFSTETLEKYHKAKRIQDFTDKWRGIQAEGAVESIGSVRQSWPALKAFTKFSIPSLLDELEK